jgi:tRNA 2-thiouridine synthesizing protein E
MGRQILRDAEGYLFQPDDWCEEVAHMLAKEEGIELNANYWPILNFIRGYHREHDVTPDVRHLVSHLASENQCEKKEAKRLVFE